MSFTKALLTTVLLLATTTSFAFKQPSNNSTEEVARGRGGSGDPGGGLAVGNELLDFIEAKKGGAATFRSIKSHRCYAELDAKLANDKIISGATAEYLRSILTSSKWYTVNYLNELPKEKLHILVINIKGVPTQVAVQSDGVIKILKSFFDQATCSNFNGLIVHELFMNIALDYELKHDVVRELTRHLFSSEIAGDDVPAHALDDLMFGYGFWRPIQLSREHLTLGAAFRKAIAVGKAYDKATDPIAKRGIMRSSLAVMETLQDLIVKTKTINQIFKHVDTLEIHLTMYAYKSAMADLDHARTEASFKALIDVAKYYRSQFLYVE